MSCKKFDKKVCKRLYQKIAQKFCQKVLSNSPLALRYAIDTILEGQDMPFREAMLFEASSFGLCAASEDMKEGIKAFLEKRKPNFKGR